MQRYITNIVTILWMKELHESITNDKCNHLLLSYFVKIQIKDKSINYYIHELNN